MKKLFAGLSAASLIMLALAAPVLAQPQDRNHNDRGRQPMRHAPARQSYHQGQNWHGHRLAYHNGHWGYYQPRNGASVFINIPL